MTESDAATLNHIHLKRISSRIRWLLNTNQIALDEAQAKANEFSAQDLEPYNLVEDGDDNDPVLLEALAMAETAINARMAAEGLPPPRNIDQHARALVKAMPSLVEKARLRVEARYKASILPGT